MRKRLCFLLICISFIGTFFIVKADSTATEVAQDSTFNSSRITGYQEFGEIMLSDPKINAYINYCGERYYYIEHTRTNDDVTNYGITNKGYPTTYFSNVTSNRNDFKLLQKRPVINKPVDPTC